MSFFFEGEGDAPAADQNAPVETPATDAPSTDDSAAPAPEAPAM